MGSWNDLHLNSPFGQGAPPISRIKGTEQRLAAGAQQSDAARIRRRHIVSAGPQMDSPQLQLVLRELLHIDILFEENRLFGCVEAGQQLRLEHAELTPGILDLSLGCE